MRAITTVASLERFGRIQLSKNFHMREMLYSEVANFHGLSNIPDDPELAVHVGRQLCETLLEPLNEAFGRIIVRSAYRSETVNGFCNARQREKKKGYGCASNEANYAGHIWDRRDAEGRAGATASVVVPWFAERYENGMPWQAMAWWVHDHLPYSDMQFFPAAAFNISWHEKPKRRIHSFIPPKGYLTRPGMPNHAGSHADHYPDFPTP